MADKIKVGSAIVELRATLDKYKDDFNKAKSFTKKNAKDLESNLNKIKIQMDDRLAKMKLDNVRKLHKKLKARLEEKIHLNFDKASINRTKAQLKSVENALEKVRLKSQGINKAGSGGIGNIFGSVSGLGKAGIIGFALSQVVSLGKEAAKAQGEIEGVETAFNKLNRPNLLTELRDAVKGSISDFELMRATLTGLDLGATEDQLKTFAKFARLESIRKGVDILQVYNNILGGVLRGSTELLDNFGISLTELNREIEILAEDKLNKAATNLSAVERRMLSVDAATKIMNERLLKTGNIAETSASKIATISSKFDNVSAKLGKAFKPILSQTLDMVNDLIDGFDTLMLKAQGTGTANSIPQLDFNAGKWDDKALNRLKNNEFFVPGEGWIKVTKEQEKFVRTVKTVKEELKTLQTQLTTTVGIDDTKTRDLLLKRINEKQKVIDAFLHPKAKKAVAPKIDGDGIAIKLPGVSDVKEQLDAFNKAYLENTVKKNEIFLENQEKRTAKELADAKKVAEERIRLENEAHRMQMSAISEFGYAIEGLGSHGETMVSYFNAALQAALRIVEAVNTMGKDKFSGILGIFSGVIGLATKFIPGLASGGSVTNKGGSVSFQPYQKFASGTSGFIVPPGFNRDNYIVGVQSGERLDVTPANQVGSSDKTLGAILRGINRTADRVGAMNGNLIESMNELITVNINKQMNALMDNRGIYLSTEQGKTRYNRTHV